MKFTEFFNIPVPQNSPISGVLEMNFQALARAINYIGQDLSSPKDEFMVLTAGEALVAGDLACLASDGAMHKADASDTTYSTSLLGIATETIASGATGKFQTKGVFDTGGLTLGSPYFLSTTGGTWQNSSPRLSGEISRVIGYALTTTTMYFDPDNTWIELE